MKKYIFKIALTLKKFFIIEERTFRAQIVKKPALKIFFNILGNRTF